MPGFCQGEGIVSLPSLAVLGLAIFGSVGLLENVQHGLRVSIMYEYCIRLTKHNITTFPASGDRLYFYICLNVTLARCPNVTVARRIQDLALTVYVYICKFLYNVLLIFRQISLPYYLNALPNVTYEQAFY